jgi:hypothetical protein
MVDESPYPPEGFNPLEATDAELEEYALPPRPSAKEEEELEEWTEMMSLWTYEPPQPPDPCASDSVTSSSVAAGIETGTPEKNSIWAGYTATSPGEDLGYDAAYSRMTAPTSYPTSCAGSEVVDWVGIGGVAYGQQKHAGLVQAGVMSDSGNHIRAFYDVRGIGGGGLNIEKLKRDEFEVNSKDEVSVAVEWNSNHTRYIFRWFDWQTGAHKVKRMGGEEAKRRFYDPSTADFMVEAPPKTTQEETPLKKFKQITFAKPHTRKLNGKFFRLGEDFPEEWDMFRHGVEMASPEGLFKTGFTDVWHACDG